MQTNPPDPALVALAQAAAPSLESDHLTLFKEENGVFWPVLRTVAKPGQRFMLKYKGQIDQLYSNPVAPGFSTPQRDCPEQEANTCTGGMPERTTRSGSEAITVVFATGQLNECDSGNGIASVIAPSAAAPALEGQSPQQNEAPALAKSAQSAIETVAFHYPKAAPSISISFPDQAWFHSDAFYGAIDAFKVCQSRLGLSLITNHYAEGNRFSADVQITPAQARSIAAMLLNAADFAEANPHFGKVAA